MPVRSRFLWRGLQRTGECRLLRLLRCSLLRNSSDAPDSSFSCCFPETAPDPPLHPIYQCPGDPNNPCSGHGLCTPDARCLCECNWGGTDCSVKQHSCNCEDNSASLCRIGKTCGEACGTLFQNSRENEPRCSGVAATGSMRQQAGVRLADGATCACRPGWWSANCTLPCPGVNVDNSGAACGGRGTCDVETGRCVTHVYIKRKKKQALSDNGVLRPTGTIRFVCLG